MSMYVKSVDEIRCGLHEHAEHYTIFSIDVDEMASHIGDVDMNKKVGKLFEEDMIALIQLLQKELTDRAIEILVSE